MSESLSVATVAEAQRILDAAARRVLAEQSPTKGDEVTTAMKERPAKTDADRERERQERFRKVAGFRANKALDYLERLLHTADTTRYAYGEGQTAEIVSKLREAVDQVEAAYAGSIGKRLRVEL